CSLGLRSIKGLRVSNQSNFLITKLSRVLHPMNKEKPDSIIQTILHKSLKGDYYKVTHSTHFSIYRADFSEYKGLRHLQRALENIAIVRLGTYVTFVNYSTSILEAYDAVNMLARGWIVAFILGGKGITFLS
ncbi:hypothetical protein ACJX0J_000732, partial (mitochondrion) [Zea mays]